MGQRNRQGFFNYTGRRRAEILAISGPRGAYFFQKNCQGGKMLRVLKFRTQQEIKHRIRVIQCLMIGIFGALIFTIIVLFHFARKEDLRRQQIQIELGKWSNQINGEIINQQKRIQPDTRFLQLNSSLRAGGFHIFIIWIWKMGAGDYIPGDPLLPASGECTQRNIIYCLIHDIAIFVYWAGAGPGISGQSSRHDRKYGTDGTKGKAQADGYRKIIWLI